MKRTDRMAVSVGIVAMMLSGASASADWRDDLAIERAFKDALDRKPTSSEMRRYRVLMEEDHWSERDVRDDLEERSDYRRHSKHPIGDPDRVIRRAYEDILHREPDAAGLRLYRGRMIDDDWTEAQLRETLRKSPEFAVKGRESAEKVARRAYQDVLGRQPDPTGLYNYMNQVEHHGWDEHDVREALRRSPENRQKNAITRSEAEQVVRRAYLSVLGREPDPGSAGWVDHVMRDHWMEGQVARELRNSDEYRNKNRK